MAVVTMRQLIESGAHFGHQTKRWNPKMKRFIFTERNGIYIIDLTQTLGYIDRAYDFVKETVAHGGTIMFIGTKRQAQEAIVEQAGRVGMPYVTERWLGGMLTNFQTVYKRLQRLKELELIESTGGQTVLTKKEALVLSRERIKLQRTLGGIREMTRTPSAVWVVDTNKEHLAVNEARKLGIPVVAILDTNCDPDLVDYKVPGNDDAIRSIQVLTRVIADAVAEGLMARAGANANAGSEDKPSYDAAPAGQLAGDEPLPDWERELLTGGAAAAVAPVEGAAVEGAGAGTSAAQPPAAPAAGTEASAAGAPAAEAPATEAPATEAPPPRPPPPRPRLPRGARRGHPRRAVDPSCAAGPHGPAALSPAPRRPLPRDAPAPRSPLPETPPSRSPACSGAPSPCPTPETRTPWLPSPLPTSRSSARPPARA